MRKELKFKYLVFVILLLFTNISIYSAYNNYNNYDNLMKTANNIGFVKVIVKIRVEKISELTLKSNSYNVIEPRENYSYAMADSAFTLENAIMEAAYNVLSNLNHSDYKVNHFFSTVPFIALDVSQESLAILSELPEILSIVEDKPNRLVLPDKNNIKPKNNTKKKTDISKPMLNNTVGIIGAENAWTAGHTGEGWSVAVLDTGVRRTHAMFSGKTIDESCYSAAGHCPGGVTEKTGIGSAIHYSSVYAGYDHGTHVSGIAIGNNGSLYGVAKDSDLIAIQVFSKFEDCDSGTVGNQPCVMSYTSDQVKGLERVYNLRGTYSISSVNMSLGGGSYSSPCDSESQKAAIDNLRTVGIATVIATGNNGYCGAISSPACISSSISIGASTDGDAESSFNNWHQTLLKLFAPGSSIYSATGSSDTSYSSWNGTSMATPHVAGAWALMKQANPSGTVTVLYDALESTGTLITTGCTGDAKRPRINVDLAINTFNSNSVAVTTPNGSETYQDGDEIPISWTSTGITGNVKITLRKSDGSGGYTIVSSTPYNNSPYNYTIPSSVLPGEYFVKVKQGTVNGISNNFTIADITVSSPSSGQSYSIGQQIPINWTTSSISGNVKITLRKSDGSGGHTIIGTIAHDTGTYNYTIPGEVIAGTYFVKVKQGIINGKTDNFTITSGNSITVTGPTGGQTYETGDQIPITWTSSGITGNVKITLRKSDGSGGYTVVNSIAYDSSPFNYNIPCSVSAGTYFIKVKQGTLNGVSGTITIGSSGTCISLSSPLEGTSFVTGNQIPIQWSTSGITGDVKITLRKSDGSGGYTIISSIAHDTGTYNYTIPGGIASGTYFIKVKQGTLNGKTGLININ